MFKTKYKNRFIIIILLLSLIVLNNTEDVENGEGCSECTKATIDNKNCAENSECKWFQIGINTFTFLKCEGINNSEKKYYTKGVTIDGKIYCRQLGINGFPNKKIIDGTNQIIRDCNDFELYELGDKCYHSIVDNIILINENSKKLKCKYKNYIEIQDNGLKYYICLNEGEDCPEKYNYYDPETKECLNNCPYNKKRISLLTNSSGKKYYQCTAKCEQDGYDKELAIKSYLNKNIDIFHCYENCPDEAPYYYENNNKKNCVQKCDKNQKDFILEEKMKCTNDLSQCNSFFLIDTKKNYYECKNEEFINCPNDYPYKYENNGKIFCLSSCEDTNTYFFDNKQTYLHLENKECTNIQPTSDSEGNSVKYYIDEKSKKWVVDCKNVESGPFHESNKCVDRCKDKYIVDDTYECVNSCDTSENAYYIDEETKTCYKNCPETLGRGFLFKTK